MAEYVTTGANVHRFDKNTPSVWNNFFKNASKVFGVPTEKVMPFDAALSMGDRSNWDNQGINTIDENHLGATFPAGDMDIEGRVAISDSVNLPWQLGGNTAEHEYMHNIDTHFADHQPGMYGKSPSIKYQQDLISAASNELGPISPSYEKYLDYNYKRDANGNSTGVYTTPLDRYLQAPEVYKNELAKSITGYGGRDGDYEFQMMKDSWEKRGPMNQYYSSVNESERAELMKQLELESEGMTPASKQAYINERMSKEIFLNPNNAQQKALEDAFINNPSNDRLGDAKELIAPMVAQSLSDDDYDQIVNNKYYTGRGAGIYAGDTANGKGYETAMKPAYITRYGGGPLDQRRADPDYAYQIRNEPAAYHNSVSERFARLGGQYMKENRSEAGYGNEFNQHEFSGRRPNKELSFVQDDFLKGMGILLNK